MTAQMSLVAARSHALGGVRALVMAAGFTLSACGGAGDSPANGGPPASPQAGQKAASADLDPCALVTSAEAAEALGGAVGSGERPKEANFPPRMVTCRYTAPRGQGVAVMTVLVQRSDTADQARRGFLSAKEQFPGATSVAGLGDDAFAVGNQLHVLTGPLYVNVAGDFELSTARVLVERALQRLS